jgi:hypothetical protein
MRFRIATGLRNNRNERFDARPRTAGEENRVWNLNRALGRSMFGSAAGRAYVGCLLGALAVAGCAGKAPQPPPAGAPYVVGRIESITHHATGSGILVRGDREGPDACGLLASVNGDTLFWRRTATGSVERTSLAELQVGSRVEVYVRGPLAESCPVQGRAATVVLAPRRAP